MPTLSWGEAQRAIGFYEQQLVITREIGDAMGVATASFNLALLYAQQGEPSRALPLAQQAAEIWGRIGHTQYAQRARQLVAQLQGGVAPSGGPSPAQVLAQFGPLIEAVAVAAQGHHPSRAAVEDVFEALTQGGWMVADPIRRIWADERDGAALTAGLDPNSALIVREILKRLK